VVSAGELILNIDARILSEYQKAFSPSDAITYQDRCAIRLACVAPLWKYRIPCRPDPPEQAIVVQDPSESNPRDLLE